MTANRKVTARYAEIARFLGLHFNEEFCVAYGEKRRIYTARQRS